MIHPKFAKNLMLSLTECCAYFAIPTAAIFLRKIAAVGIALLLLTCVKLNAVSIVPCEINRSSHRTGYVAVAMMFQNEAKYLKEWLEYHKCIGVSHFYLYNNASTDQYWDVLMPYVLSGRVELFDINEKSVDVYQHNNFQKEAYNHAVNLAKGYNDWLAIIDSDEFICMPHHDNLKKFLKSYRDARGIAINWVMYGSSGIEELGTGALQIESFVYRAPDEWAEHFLFKSIVRPEFVTRADIHHCVYRKDSIVVHANNKRFSNHPKFTRPPIDDIRINHYWWRDEKYFREVKRPRRLEWLSGYGEADVNERRSILNSVYDGSMAPFIEKVRARMK